MNNNNEVSVIFGATSAVAQAVIRKLAASNASMFLVARDAGKLETVSQDAAARGANLTGTVSIDLGNPDELGTHVKHIVTQAGSIQSWYFFQGVLPDQAELENDWSVFEECMNTNFTGIARILHLVANDLEQKSATRNTDEPVRIIVVSSVAGLRGRKSNYGYGTAKGALNIYLAGLRNRLSSQGHTVTTILPGFIRTPMTAHLDTSGFLWATPERVAQDILKAADSGKDIVFTPWIWRCIMMVIRSIPEKLFKRLSL